MMSYYENNMYDFAKISTQLICIEVSRALNLEFVHQLRSNSFMKSVNCFQLASDERIIN